MGLISGNDLIAYDMDLGRAEGEESKIQARFIHGTAFTMTFWSFRPGAMIPEHKHEHETLTTVLSGALRLTVDGHTMILRAGDSGLVPSWQFMMLKYLRNLKSSMFTRRCVRIMWHVSRERTKPIFGPHRNRQNSLWNSKIC